MRVSLWIIIAICAILQFQDAVATKKAYNPKKKCNCTKPSNNHDWARVGIVQLFRWSFKDIARECEKYLGPNFFYAVQVSPITDHPIVTTPYRPWWEVYQPVSYRIISRAGNEEEFRDMCDRCNRAGVRVFVDLVLNHMSHKSYENFKTCSGAKYDADKLTYSDASVGFTACHFHKSCKVTNYNDVANVRNGWLHGAPDLKTEDNYVRDKQVAFINKIIDFGVSGINIDMAMHIAVADLKYIKSKLKCLNTKWFGVNEKVFIYQEVADLGHGPIKQTEYLEIGAVEQFKFSKSLSDIVLGKSCITSLKDVCMKSLAKSWGLVESENAIVCIDNHDTQRDRILSNVITYQDREKYLMAYSFMFAANYGKIRIMSSYKFSSDKKDAGPPCDASGKILSPEFDNRGQCNNGWVCEHRWPEIRALVHMKFIAKLKKLHWEMSNWWTAGQNQIAFSVGYYAMFIYNTSNTDCTIRVKTSLDCGVYCDIFSGGMVGGKCHGYEIRVEEGYASVTVKKSTKMVFLHLSNRLAA